MVTILGSRAALAEEVTARLEWRRAHGAEACMDGARLEAAVNTRWRRHVFTEGSTDLLVEGKVARRAHG
jgi:hypothetical protein